MVDFPKTSSDSGLLRVVSLEGVGRTGRVWAEMLELVAIASPAITQAESLTTTRLH